MAVSFRAVEAKGRVGEQTISLEALQKFKPSKAAQYRAQITTTPLGESLIAKHVTGKKYLDLLAAVKTGDRGFWFWGIGGIRKAVRELLFTALDLAGDAEMRHRVAALRHAMDGDNRAVNLVCRLLTENLIDAQQSKDLIKILTGEANKKGRYSVQKPAAGKMAELQEQLVAVLERSGKITADQVDSLLKGVPKSSPRSAGTALLRSALEALKGKLSTPLAPLPGQTPITPLLPSTADSDVSLGLLLPPPLPLTPPPLTTREISDDDREESLGGEKGEDDQREVRNKFITTPPPNGGPPPPWQGGESEVNDQPLSNEAAHDGASRLSIHGTSEGTDQEEDGGRQSPSASSVASDKSHVDDLLPSSLAGNGGPSDRMAESSSLPPQLPRGDLVPPLPLVLSNLADDSAADEDGRGGPGDGLSSSSSGNSSSSDEDGDGRGSEVREASMLPSAPSFAPPSTTPPQAPPVDFDQEVREAEALYRSESSPLNRDRLIAALQRGANAPGEDVLSLRRAGDYERRLMELDTPDQKEVHTVRAVAFDRRVVGCLLRRGSSPEALAMAEPEAIRLSKLAAETLLRLAWQSTDLARRDYYLKEAVDTVFTDLMPFLEDGYGDAYYLFVEALKVWDQELAAVQRDPARSRELPLVEGKWEAARDKCRDFLVSTNSSETAAKANATLILWQKADSLAGRQTRDFRSYGLVMYLLENQALEVERDRKLSETGEHLLLAADLLKKRFNLLLKLRQNGLASRLIQSDSSWVGQFNLLKLLPGKLKKKYGEAKKALAQRVVDLKEQRRESSRLEVLWRRACDEELRLAKVRL